MGAEWALDKLTFVVVENGFCISPFFSSLKVVQRLSKPFDTVAVEKMLYLMPQADTGLLLILGEFAQKLFHQSFSCHSDFGFCFLITQHDILPNLAVGDV